MANRRIASTIVLFVLCASCTTSPSEPSQTTSAQTPEGTDSVGGPAELPGALVVENGSLLTVMTPDGATLGELPGSIDGGQPTWSPDGTQIVWSTTDDAGSAGVAIGEPGSASDVHGAPFFPFYYSWSPEGTRVGMLGTGSSGIEFAMLDVAAGAITTVDMGAPFYFDWSPDGRTVVAHVGTSELRMINIATGEDTTSVKSTGLFQAPQWTEAGIFYQESTASSIQARGLTLQRTAQGSTMQRLVLGDTTTVREEIARFEGSSAFAVSGDRIAYLKPTDPSARRGPELYVKELGGQETQVASAGVFAFQWSPDGQHLLILEPTVEAEGPRLRWAVWSDDGEVIRFAGFQPTPTFVARYLPFWDQYNRSLTIWAPDSSAFVYGAVTEAGSAEILVQQLNSGVGAEVVATGEFASWSPQPREDLAR